MRKIKRYLAVFFAVLLLWGLAAIPSVYGLDDDEYDGYRADTLEIEVGYFGGPYYAKHTFTLEELSRMNLVTGDYTFIDNMPSVVIDHVKGVRLSDLMEAAGIDLGSVQTFYFWTRDKTSDYYTSFTKTALIDTPRYCYYSLPDNFDSETGKGNEYAAGEKQRVETLIALGDDWNRCIAGATFGSDYENLNTNTRFRLIYGQTDTVTRTADRSAKWIHKIVVALGGAPTLTLDKSVLDLKVGSVHRVEARVKAADPAIAEQLPVTWRSSDESVATVDRQGRITVHREGSAAITAEAGGLTATLSVNGTPGTGTGGPPSDAGSGPGEEADSGQPDGVTEIRETDTREDPNSILPGGLGPEREKGGVQNWRVYEMASDASELPEIPRNNPLLPHTGIFAACLFAGGLIIRILKYRYDMEEKPHVFSRKFQ